MFDSLKSRIFSTTPAPTQKKTSAIGAYVGDDPYKTYASTLSWIRETKAKLPDGSMFEISPSMREEAFNVDPLLKGIIAPYLKNTVLGDYSIQTEDNKKYAPAIKEIRQYLNDIGMLDAFREDFIDYAIIHGHSYRRKDPNGDDIETLSPLKNSTIRTYRDPWDASVEAYHQKIHVQNAWSDTNISTTEYNSWFIPGGMTYIEGELEDPKAKAIFDGVKEKYGITDITHLRVDSADRIIAMHRVEPGEPAPIDSAILAIWLKRLLLTNSPNIIFRVLSPFVHIKNGLVLEVTGADGGKDLITTVPQQPPEGMKTTDPERYAAENSIFESWKTACQSAVTTVIKCLKDGGVFSSGPDMSMEVIESGRTVPSEFIKTMLDLLDQEIGQAFGFPVALVKANGSELATSRTILELFNATYAGVRRDYETIADELIREKFAGMSWSFEIPGKDEQMETGKFTFEEMEASFLLETTDIKDILKEAQAKLTDAKTLQAIKSIGAGKGDIQALGEEAGFGLLELENFDVANDIPIEPEATPVQSTIKEDMQPSDEDDGELSRTLMKIYKDAQNAVKGLTG